MNTYLSGTVIKQLREKKGTTQAQLAQLIGVTDKAVSKWETGKGLPDITLLEPLANALGVSLIELMKGEFVSNGNRAANVMRSKFYVCPICGNIVVSMGESVVSCCGINLPSLEAEEMEEGHQVQLEPVEDEFFISIDHPMTKDHYISFVAFAANDNVRLIKLYPEGEAQCRMKIRGHGFLYIYCNHHGLFKKRI